MSAHGASSASIKQIDPDCPTNARSALIILLEMLAVASILAGAAGAVAAYRHGQRMVSDLAAVSAEMLALDIASPPFGALEIQQRIGWTWTGAGVLILVQGIVVCAVLFSLASITESVRGIRISSKAAAQAARHPVPPTA